jgi:hypothetical protein
MRFMGAPCAFGFASRVDAEHDATGFLPRRARRSGVEQP